MYQRILVPVDGSETSNYGLAEAIRLAQLTNGSLRLVHVIDALSLSHAMAAYAGPSDDWLGSLRVAGSEVLNAAKGLALQAGITVETLLCDNLKDALHEVVTAEAASWDADLLVIGTHGRRGFNRILMGSGAEQILRVSPVPVLLVRAPDAPVSHERTHKLVENLHLPVGVVAYE
jgi:nucleotide-binding universal stress UspA family protein